MYLKNYGLFKKLFFLLKTIGVKKQPEVFYIYLAKKLICLKLQKLSQNINQVEEVLKKVILKKFLRSMILKWIYDIKTFLS